MPFDRYTLLKWKESFHGFPGGFSGTLGKLYAAFNASPLTRTLSVVCLLAAVLLAGGVVGMLRPEPPVPLHKRLVLSKTDDQKDVWTLDFLKNQDIQAIVDGPVKTGEPLTLTVKFLRDRQFLMMKPEIIGAAGEQYFPGILKNGQWQEPPGFLLKDHNDRLLVKGQFEYG